MDLRRTEEGEDQVKEMKEEKVQEKKERKKRKRERTFLNGFLSCAAHHGQRGVAQSRGCVDKRKTEKGCMLALT